MYPQVMQLAKIGKQAQIWSKMVKYFYHNCIPLVLPFIEYTICPELFSSANFRIHGGVPKAFHRTEENTEILVSNIGLVKPFCKESSLDMGIVQIG